MIKDLFIKLTSTTNPHSNWNETREDLISKIPVELTKDMWGNYYHVVGESSNMFTCHLDTAGDYTRVNHRVRKKGSQEFICTDGKTPLGADDKAGIVVLVNMIQANIPGLYYFFIGEEVGGKGSKMVADNFYNVGHIDGIKHIISFDRKAHTSIITHQNETRCCTDEYADKLVQDFAKNGLKMEKDPTGRVSDSMSFYHIPQICEITNISVGYFNEHTNEEYQDITFLEKLVNAVTRMDWIPPVIEECEEDEVKESYLIREFATFMQSRS